MSGEVMESVSVEREAKEPKEVTQKEEETPTETKQESSVSIRKHKSLRMIVQRTE